MLKKNRIIVWVLLCAVIITMSFSSEVTEAAGKKPVIEVKLKNAGYQKQDKIKLEIKNKSAKSIVVGNTMFANEVEDAEYGLSFCMPEMSKTKTINKGKKVKVTYKTDETFSLNKDKSYLQVFIKYNKKYYTYKYYLETMNGEIIKGLGDAGKGVFKNKK